MFYSFSKLTQDPYHASKVYDTIHMGWGSGSSETDVTLHNTTLSEAYKVAQKFGYQPPKWWMPWQYFTGGIWVVTVG